MRILHLVSYPLFSGPLPPTLGLAMAQRDLGHRVWLGFDTKRGNFNGYEEAAEPRVVARGLEPPWAFTLSAKSSLAEYWRDWRTLRRLIRQRAVDVLHLHLSHDHGLAALAGVHPGLVRVRTIHAERSLRPRFGQAWLTHRAEGWIARCPTHRETLVQRFGVAPSRLRVIEGSIDADFFAEPRRDQRTRARRRFDLQPGDRVMAQVALMAGRGQEELLEAVRALGEQRLRVLLVGRGEQESALRARAETLGLGSQVRFTGYLAGSDLLDVYWAADGVFVAQPGNDGSVRAALEAMAVGQPTLAVQTGALAELVDDAVGLPIADRRVESIAAALRCWLTDPADAAARGRAARQRMVTERQPRREAERTIAFYRELRALGASVR